MIPFAEGKRALAGAWRLLRLDSGGMADFNATPEGFWRSFWAAALVAPAYAIMAWPMLGALEGDALLHGVIIEAIAYVVTWTAFPLAMNVLAQRLDRDAFYIRYIVANNWASVLQVALFLIALGLAHAARRPAAGLLLTVAASGLVIGYQWFVARTALQVTGRAAAGVVALDMLLGLAINGIADAMIEG